MAVKKQRIQHEDGKREQVTYIDDVPLLADIGSNTTLEGHVADSVIHTPGAPGIFGTLTANYLTKCITGPNIIGDSAIREDYGHLAIGTAPTVISTFSVARTVSGTTSGNQYNMFSELATSASGGVFFNHWFRTSAANGAAPQRLQALVFEVDSQNGATVSVSANRYGITGAILDRGSSSVTVGTDDVYIDAKGTYNGTTSVGGTLIGVKSGVGGTGTITATQWRGVESIFSNTGAASLITTGYGVYADASSAKLTTGYGGYFKGKTYGVYIDSGAGTDELYVNGTATIVGQATVGTLTDGTASLTGGSLTAVKLGTLTTNGFVKTSGGDGTLSVSTSIDISSDTNLAATAPIILTGDTLSLDYEATDFSVVGSKLTITDSGIDHGGLGGLTDDDHVDYARLGGRNGGQTLYGGKGASETLTLLSTSHATKGKVNIGGTLTVDGVNLRLGVNITAPLYALDVYTTASQDQARIWSNNHCRLRIESAATKERMIEFTDTTNGVRWIMGGEDGGIAANEDFVIESSNNKTNPEFWIDRTNGNIGMGTIAAPTTELHVYRASDYAYITAQTADAAKEAGFYAKGTGANGWYIYTNSSDNLKFYDTADRMILNSGGGLVLTERTSDPPEPAEGQMVIWMSDGTGKGDDGDVLIASKAGGTTKYSIIFDHSAGSAW